MRMRPDTIGVEKNGCRGRGNVFGPIGRVASAAGVQRCGKADFVVSRLGRRTGGGVGPPGRRMISRGFMPRPSVGQAPRSGKIKRVGGRGFAACQILTRV